MSAPHLRVVYTRPALHLVPDNEPDGALCERCETWVADLAACDHVDQCEECATYYGCHYCQADARCGL